MSHFTKIQTQIKDIAALKAACGELKLDLVQDEVVRGYTKRDAAYVIKLNGAFDVGLELDAATQSWGLVYDKWNNYVHSELGTDCGKLIQRYAVCKVEMEARKKGLSVFRKYMDNGNIQVVLQEMAI